MAKKQTWTVVAYIVADHAEIPSEHPDKIDEVAHLEVDNIMWAADLDQVNLAVQVDFTQRPGVLRVIGKAGGFVRTLLPETNASRIETFKRFLDAVKADCPADHYMMMFWGHGAGPIGMFFDRNSSAQGSAQSDQTPQTMSLAELKDVLAYANEAFGRHLDIFLVKSCEMALAESAWEVRGSAKRMICSQARVPLRAWSYGDMFKALDPDGDVEKTGVQLLAALAKQFDEPAERRGRMEVPYSLIDPDALEGLVPAVRALVLALQVVGPETAAVQKAITGARPIRAGDKALLDLAILCERLQDVPELTGPAKRVVKALASVVLAHEPADSAFRGLGIFCFPPAHLRNDSFADEVTSHDYGKLEFPALTSWGDIAFAGDKVSEVDTSTATAQQTRKKQSRA